MPPVGFEPTISAGERPQTCALDRAATGTGIANVPEINKSLCNLMVCHPRCGRSIVRRCSVYISVYTYSHEHNYITVSSDI